MDTDTPKLRTQESQPALVNVSNNVTSLVLRALCILVQGCSRVVWWAVKELISGVSHAQVYALIDANGDGIAEKLVVLRDDLIRPTGLAWHSGTLFIAEPGTLYRATDIDRKVLNGEIPVRALVSLRSLSIGSVLKISSDRSRQESGTRQDLSSILAKRVLLFAQR